MKLISEPAMNTPGCYGFAAEDANKDLGIEYPLKDDCFRCIKDNSKLQNIVNRLNLFVDGDE
jgi:hypothetical protein